MARLLLPVAGAIGTPVGLSLGFEGGGVASGRLELVQV